MKKIILGLMAAMTIGATAMAQSQVADRSEMIQKRTESVAKKYGLSDEQKQKLLELNTKYTNDGTKKRRSDFAKSNSTPSMPTLWGRRCACAATAAMAVQ